jgi:pseudouridine synthase
VKKRFTGEDALTPAEIRDKAQTGIRLSKALQQLGVASRRASEEIIFAGRVQVNGFKVIQPQHPVILRQDTIQVDGKVIDGGVEMTKQHMYFLINKPRGYLCSNRSERSGGGAANDNGKLVLDLFEEWRETFRRKYPGKLIPRLFTVGRLDVNTTGMLLVTTDGQWCQRVAHPSSEVVKSYIISTGARATKNQILKMASGTDVDGVHVTPKHVESLEGSRDGGPANRVLVDVVDGRNREVRVLAQSAGVDVKKLKRVRVGGLRMPSDLPIGKYINLKPHQVGYVLDKGLMNNEKSMEAKGKMGMY